MDKQKEEKILKMIYSQNDFEIIGTEEPDFIITDKSTAEVLGVEVTEVFHTESDARLINIPNYIEKIIDKGQYFHKADLTELSVEQVKIHPSGLDASPREIKCIIRDVPSREQVGTIISNAISKKNEKIINYRKKAKKNCLIIFDNEHFIKSKGDLSSILSLGLIKSIVDSGFDRIYFLTKVENEMIYYELKGSCFVILAFLTLIFYKHSNIQNPDRFYLTLDTLNGLGFGIETFFSDKEDCIKVKCWNAVVCFKEKNEELIIDRIFTDGKTQSEEFQEFIPVNSVFEDIKEQYYKFIFTKIVIMDLSHKVSIHR